MPCFVLLEPLQEDYAAAYANCHRSNDLDGDAVRANLPTVVRPHANNPFSTTLGSAIRNATFTLNQQMDPLLIRDQQMPLSLMNEAQGLVFLTFLRVGIFGGLKCGSGLVVIKRDDDTWSAPSAVGMGGAFIGVTFGADIVNLCLVLTSKKVCQGFLSSGQLNFEGELGVSIGPIGRNASAGAIVKNGLAPVYSYAQSKGFLVGIDVNGSYIYTRRRVNQKFYGVPLTAEHILRDAPQPEAGRVLHDAILRLTDKAHVAQSEQNCTDLQDLRSHDDRELDTRTS